MTHVPCISMEEDHSGFVVAVCELSYEEHVNLISIPGFNLDTLIG